MAYRKSTPEEMAAREAALNADNLAKACAVKDAAADLHKSLALSGGKYTSAQMFQLLDFCNAVIGLTDDGDCMAQRDILMEELRCDTDGKPLGLDADLVPFKFCTASTVRSAAA